LRVTISGKLSDGEPVEGKAKRRIGRRRSECHNVSDFIGVIVRSDSYEAYTSGTNNGIPTNTCTDLLRRYVKKIRYTRKFTGSTVKRVD
jgi:hypothetical protein